MIKLLQFTIYYLQKRTNVFFGFHRTRNPLSISWRWHYWLDNYEEIRKTKQQKPAPPKSKPKESF